MISIIIPTYQHGDIIEKCLDSIYQQTYQKFEVIVVNDGSRDNTIPVLENYPKPLTIINQENQGANKARNNGFAKSQGEYVIFCDADLILKGTMLEKMLKALKENPDKAYAYSAFKWGFKTFKLWPFDSEKLKKMNYIHTTSLIRRETFPGFDENIKRLQDWDLWLAMLEQNHKGAYIPEVLFQVHPRKTGMSEWIPSLAYKIPFAKLGIKMKKVEKYKKAEKIIKKKHSLL